MIRVANPAFFFSSRRRHTRCGRDWSSDVCSSDLAFVLRLPTSKSNITFIANNTLTFSLSKKDIINTTKLNKFENTLFNFDNLHYLDDKYKDLNIKYQNQKKLTVSHKNLFTHIFNIITYQKNKIKI